MTQLPVGKLGQVTLHYGFKEVNTNNFNAFTDADSSQWFIVEPIPAGTAVIENSLVGDFSAYHLQPGRIVFCCRFAVFQRHNSLRTCRSPHGQ